MAVDVVQSDSQYLAILHSPMIEFLPEREYYEGQLEMSKTH